MYIDGTFFGWAALSSRSSNIISTNQQTARESEQTCHNKHYYRFKTSIRKPLREAGNIEHLW